MSLSDLAQIRTLSALLAEATEVGRRRPLVDGSEMLRVQGDNWLAEARVHGQEIRHLALVPPDDVPRALELAERGRFVVVEFDGAVYHDAHSLARAFANARPSGRGPEYVGAEDLLPTSPLVRPLVSAALMLVLDHEDDEARAHALAAWRRLSDVRLLNAAARWLDATWLDHPDPIHGPTLGHALLVAIFSEPRLVPDELLGELTPLAVRLGMVSQMVDAFVVQEPESRGLALLEAASELRIPMEADRARRIGDVYANRGQSKIAEAARAFRAYPPDVRAAFLRGVEHEDPKLVEVVTTSWD
jgi:hypothetical protein